MIPPIQPEPIEKRKEEKRMVNSGCFFCGRTVKEEPTFTFEEEPAFIFKARDIWLIKITEKGVFFNKEKYPDCSPDEFATAFIKILEKNYDVKFEKKVEYVNEK